MTSIEQIQHVARLRSFGAHVKGNKVILYRGADAPESEIRQLRYGDYLSATQDGLDVTGNAGAGAYGKNCVRFELPVADVTVTGAGEFQFKGESPSLTLSAKYPVEIYRAYNDAYGSNYTSDEIDKQDNVRVAASQSLPGGREEFDALMATHTAVSEGEMVSSHEESYRGFTIFIEPNPDRNRGGFQWSVCKDNVEHDCGLELSIAVALSTARQSTPDEPTDTTVPICQS